MKRSHSVYLAIALVATVLCSQPGFCEEKRQTRHWYRLEIQTGDTTYQCLGSSTLDEKEFAKQLAGEEYIVLDDVAYIDSTGKAKGWQEWDSRSVPRLYVNPDYVIFFNPMKDDPRKTAAGKAATDK